MEDSGQRLEWAIKGCGKAQIRITPVRRAILSYLAAGDLPMTLEVITRAEGVKGRWNSSTVYRTLMLFKDIKVVRLVGTPNKTSYFILNIPDENGHFLICRGCGCIKRLTLSDVAAESIRRAMVEKGFSLSGMDHEVYGLCTKCDVELRNAALPSKLVAHPKVAFRSLFQE